jgi:hypothetical protein
MISKIEFQEMPHSIAFFSHIILNREENLHKFPAMNDRSPKASSAEKCTVSAPPVIASSNRMSFRKSNYQYVTKVE